VSERAHEWSRGEVVALLQRVDLFDGLPGDDLNSIAAIVGGRTVQADERLFQEGDPGDAFYIVFRGAVEICKARADGTEEKLAVRRRGDGFGEMALLDDVPRSATARATEETQLVSVARDDFQQQLGGDSLALRMMRALSNALRALSVRFANADRAQESFDELLVTDEFAVSRVMQASLLPRGAPKVTGYDIAAGTTTEKGGRGSSIWDWIELGDGRTALLSVSVPRDGLPPAHHLGTSRAVVRAVAARTSSVADLLRGSNEALASAGVDGLDQFIQMGVLVVSADGLEWGSAGKAPGGVIRRDGSFEQLGAQGPPLGMMGGFQYKVQSCVMNAGDTAFVLSHGSQGLFLGAADLLAQLHGKPAGEIVASLHKAIRKAQRDERSETSVLYVRRH